MLKCCLLELTSTELNQIARKTASLASSGLQGKNEVRTFGQDEVEKGLNQKLASIKGQLQWIIEKPSSKKVDGMNQKIKGYEKRRNESCWMKGIF